MSERYFVDHRSGCVAVRDSRHTDFDPDYQGLHPDTPGVVFCRGGEQVQHRCDSCKQVTHTTWTVPADAVVAAHAECERLNAAERKEASDGEK